ncbi:MAG: PAS domain-containing protein, partial [Bacteroidota bacterium]
MEEITKKTLKERIEDISGLIFEVANGNFDYTIDPSGEDDELDAIIYGVNMLGQELKTSTVSKNHMQSMYDGIIDMMIIMNPEMIIKTVNDAFTQFTGKSSEEVTGKHLAEIIDLTKNRDLLIKINKQLDSTEEFQNAEIIFQIENGALPTSSSFSYLKNA